MVWQEESVILTDGVYPESMTGNGRSLVNKRHHFKKKAKGFYIKDGVLYKTVSGSPNGACVIKEGATEAIMTEFHSSPIGGHSGFNKTNSAVKSRYWWPKMSDDIRHYVKHCEKCQKSDPIKPAKKPDLKPINVTRPFELVGCDLMGPFHETELGYRYIFTATDYYTKWVEAFPIRTKTAKDVSECLQKLLYRHGAVNAILTDQGREFVNEVNKDLCNEWDISHRVSAAYHPQTNGLDERTNQTIKRALSKCVNESQSDWDSHLDKVLFSLRTKPQTTTKYSPFFLLYGREAQYPSQLKANFGVDENFPSCPTEEQIDADVNERKEQQKITSESVKENVASAKLKQPKDYTRANEKKRGYKEISVGDKVLKYNSERAGKKRKGDLGCNYSGPYIVSEVVGNRLRLRNENGKILKTLVSINNVKLFKEQSPQNTSDEHPIVNQPTEEPTAIGVDTFIDNLAPNNSLASLYEECKVINYSTGNKSVSISLLSRKLPMCPVLSFINEVLKAAEDEIDEWKDAVIKRIKIDEEGDFTGALLLTCCVLAKAYKEGILPIDVLETLREQPSFLKECLNANPLKNDERLTVAGEGVERLDLETLTGNCWLNDKVLNAYTKLLAREATDATDCSGSIKRMFMIPSYTAALWDAGIFRNYMFQKVDFTVYDLLVVPWNKNDNHWVVLVAFTNERTVTVYDSLGADNSSLIEKFCLFMTMRSEIVNDSLHQWEPVRPTPNKQTDGSSCGVFVLMTIECLVNGKPAWILRQIHVPMFRRYIVERLLINGARNTQLCDSLTCKDPKRRIEWVMCDVCYRWIHTLCSSKAVDKKKHFQCEICDAQYS